MDLTLPDAAISHRNAARERATRALPSDHSTVDLHPMNGPAIIRVAQFHSAVNEQASQRSPEVGTNALGGPSPQQRRLAIVYADAHPRLPRRVLDTGRCSGTLGPLGT